MSTVWNGQSQTINSHTEMKRVHVPEFMFMIVSCPPSSKLSTRSIEEGGVPIAFEMYIGGGYFLSFNG